jgi:hypothetical protein
MNRSAVPLRRVLLAGWSVWWTLVVATNLTDAAKGLGLLPEAFAFASGNYAAIQAATARYGAPPWLNGGLFAAVIVWEACAALLFWLATCHRDDAGDRWLYRAFTVGLSLWLAFLVADEICIGYAIGATHLRPFIAQLLTLLAIVWLPTRPTAP